MTPASRAQLALLLEVAGTPKPGNVDRCHDYPDLRFEHFLAGAVGAAPGLAAAVNGAPIGAAFEQAVHGMSGQRGGNTQFGALLLLVPLVRTAGGGDLTSETAAAIAEDTTVDDAAGFYRAFDHVAVAVDDPPASMEALDVRRGSAAIPALDRRGLTLHDVMGTAADHDDVAREWTNGFRRSFDAAERLTEESGAVPDRAAAVFLSLLAEAPDTFVAIQHDAETARRASERARAARSGAIDPSTLADEFVEEGINPGATADLVAAGLFIALERGDVRV